MSTLPLTKCFQLEFAVLIQQAHVGFGSDLLALFAAAATSLGLAASAAVIETVPRVAACFAICHQCLHPTQLCLQLVTKR